jgi:hypothetical protein
MPIGYDRVKENLRLLLDLQMTEGLNTSVQDYSKAVHRFALNGPPAWTPLANGLMTLDFNPVTPDYLLCSGADTADLDFTTEDFTALAWIEPDALGNRNIMTRGLTLTDGWMLWLNATGGLVLSTCQAGVDQHTIGSDVIAINTWAMVAAVRIGAAVNIFVNGEDVTLTPGVHIDPLTSARGLYIGSTDAAAAGWWDGAMWRSRIWGRALPVAELKAAFEKERYLLGV